MIATNGATRKRWAAGLAAALGFLWGASVQGGEKAPVENDLAIVLAVDKEGKGNEQAQSAWLQLASRDAYTIPKLLASLDTANPLAANYIRSAIDAVAERSIRENSPLPKDEIEKFLADTSHQARARRLAYELLTVVDPQTEERWIPKLLLDPSPELRRDGVTYWLDKAEAALSAGNKEEATTLFEKSFSGAIDEDHVNKISKRLEELGKTVDLPTHFGLIQNWKVIGPFDNTDEKGFAVVYPPEEKVDYAATYPGKNGPVTWKDFTSADAMGSIDLQAAVEKAKGVIAYAASTFTLDQPRKAQVRLGTPNGWKLWVNGELVFARDEYHSGNQFDQFSFDIDLKGGENVILFKCCQNEQKETWTNVWSFQLRVCDSTGTAVLAMNRPDVKEDPRKPPEED